MLRNSLNQNGLSHVKIVATDDYGSILPQDFVRDIFLDSELDNAIDYLG